MGMFDEIIVPKAYLRNLLHKGEERLLKTKHLFQTKDLDNVMDVYKIHRQQLYRLDRSEFLLEEGVQHTKLTDKWDEIHENKVLIFYSGVKDDEENEWWFEFEFTFGNGKLDKKKLIRNHSKGKSQRR